MSSYSNLIGLLGSKWESNEITYTTNVGFHSNLDLLNLANFTGYAGIVLIPEMKSFPTLP